MLWICVYKVYSADWLNTLDSVCVLILQQLQKDNFLMFSALKFILFKHLIPTISLSRKLKSSKTGKSINVNFSNDDILLLPDLIETYITSTLWDREKWQRKPRSPTIKALGFGLFNRNKYWDQFSWDGLLTDFRRLFGVWVSSTCCKRYSTTLCRRRWIWTVWAHHSFVCLERSCYTIKDGSGLVNWFELGWEVAKWFEESIMK